MNNLNKKCHLNNGKKNNRNSNYKLNLNNKMFLL